MSFPVLNLICTIVMLVFLHFFWKFTNRVWEDSFKYLRKWEKNPDIKTRKGFYGKLVMWNVRSILKGRYKELPQVGDLLQANHTEKMFVVTHRYQPNPISPFGYVEMMCLNEGKNDNFQVPVTSYFKDSYEKVTPDEND